MPSATRKRMPRTKHIVIGKIYADWCGHCVALKPEWEKMKRLVRLQMGRKLNHVHIDIIEMGDTEENKAAGKTVDGLIAEFNAKYLPAADPSMKVTSNGFPTIFKVCNGKVEYYQGERLGQSMYKWATQGCDETSNTRNVVRITGGRKTRTRRNRTKRVR